MPLLHKNREHADNRHTAATTNTGSGPTAYAPQEGGIGGPQAAPHPSGPGGPTGGFDNAGHRGLNDQPAYPATHDQNLGQTRHGQFGGHGDADHGYPQTAAGIPPTSQASHGIGQTTSGGSGHSLTGKIEAALGSALGSQSLKAKGLQKQQGANPVKMQGTEFTEAERLEREAMMHRERPVAQGGHPDNMRPGAGLHGPFGDTTGGQGPTTERQW